MSKRLTRIAVLGATALVLGLLAAPAAHAQAAITCLDLATFTEEPAPSWAPTAPTSCAAPPLEP